MSERVADQAGSLVRRLARHLHHKVSETLILLFNHKNARSLGAIAGFAIAVIFTWKFLRSPTRGPRRNRPKRRTSPPEGRRDGASTGTADASGSQEGYDAETRLDDSISGVDSAIELTLGQIVRRKLGGCRKMTCQLLGVILEERTPEELQKSATVRHSVVETLLEITKFCDLYLMETVLDDESEKRVLLALENAGLFQKGLVKEKVLFCSSETGRSSFTRQLEADWHADTNLEIVTQLSRFIRNQLYISSSALGQLTTNVTISTSLEQYFSSI